VVQQPNGQPRKTNRVHNGDQPQSGPGTPGPAWQALPPPPSPPSLEVLQTELEALIASNEDRFKDLIAQGTQPDPFYMIHARINHLIDAIAQATGPNGPRWAAMTRLGFERQIAQDLAQAGPVSRRMQLAEGARYTPEMIRQLARQTGTLSRRTQ
jgi:hypothetical protein